MKITLYFLLGLLYLLHNDLLLWNDECLFTEFHRGLRIILHFALLLLLLMTGLTYFAWPEGLEVDSEKDPRSMILAVIIIYFATVLAIGSIQCQTFQKHRRRLFCRNTNHRPLCAVHVIVRHAHDSIHNSWRKRRSVSHRHRSFCADGIFLCFDCAFHIFLCWTPHLVFGKRYGYLTQIQFFRDRWDSSALGLLLFIVLLALLLPYLLIGVMGGGATLNQITSGLIPEWLGGLIVCGVVLIYVTTGGMRGTAWVNTFQTLVFMIFGAARFLYHCEKYGWTYSCDGSSCVGTS